jgi:hypothetical protein
LATRGHGVKAYDSSWNPTSKSSRLTLPCVQPPVGHLGAPFGVGGEDRELVVPLGNAAVADAQRGHEVVERAAQVVRQVPEHYAPGR